RQSASVTTYAASGASTGCGRIPITISGAPPRRSWFTWRRNCGRQERMLRLVELVLFLAPFAIFAAWRLLAIEGVPSTRFVAIAACVLAALAGALIWLSERDALSPGVGYEPARLESGRIIAGHGTQWTARLFCGSSLLPSWLNRRLPP